jgi:hypothetical protein
MNNIVYEEYKVYGPYKSNKDGRLRVILIKKNIKKTISYPKYLMEIYLNKYLEYNETIDHIDGNPLNNNLSNLRILDRKLHAQQDIIRIKPIITICKWCKKEFKIINLNQRNRKNASGFCSKNCTGKYGKYIQNGGKVFGKLIFKKDKFKLRDL